MGIYQYAGAALLAAGGVWAGWPYVSRMVGKWLKPGQPVAPGGDLGDYATLTQIRALRSTFDAAKSRAAVDAIDRVLIPEAVKLLCCPAPAESRPTP